MTTEARILLGLLAAVTVLCVALAVVAWQATENASRAVDRADKWRDRTHRWRRSAREWRHAYHTTRAEHLAAAGADPAEQLIDQCLTNAAHALYDELENR